VIPVVAVERVEYLWNIPLWVLMVAYIAWCVGFYTLLVWLVQRHKRKDDDQ
jgi:hypothetical protein